MGWKGERRGQEGGIGGNLYHRADCVLVERIPPYTHHHRIHTPFLRLRAVRRNVQTRPAVVDAAFDIVVAADGEAGDGDIGRGDAELVCVSF